MRTRKDQRSVIHRVRVCVWLVSTLLLVACQHQAGSPGTPVQTVPRLTSAEPLTVDMLYPTGGTSVEMGGTMSVIIRVTNGAGLTVGDAHADIEVEDPNGRLMVVVPMKAGEEGVYRASSWLIPHRTQAGNWMIDVIVKRGVAAGHAQGVFRVEPSESETLLEKYGFWIAAPTLRGIQPSLVAERGDALNGMIRWGGVIPASHVLPEAWLEVQWRSGLNDLEGPEAVRRFLLDDVGDFGFTPIRAIGEITPFSFQGRPAWKVEMRGQYAYDDLQWVVFSDPASGKIFAIGTTVVLPPTGVNAHAILRDTFELPAGVVAHGKAPDPLPNLLPGPQQLSPQLGAVFKGTEVPVVLVWAPVKMLNPDEFYQVDLSTNYDEASPSQSFSTRDNRLTVPNSLFHRPNCGVFNWQVRLMQTDGSMPDGSAHVAAESHASFYWYFLWTPPAGSPAEFLPLCPNAQY